MQSGALLLGQLRSCRDPVLGAASPRAARGGPSDPRGIFSRGDQRWLLAGNWSRARGGVLRLCRTRAGRPARPGPAAQRRVLPSADGHIHPALRRGPHRKLAGRRAAGVPPEHIRRCGGPREVGPSRPRAPGVPLVPYAGYRRRWLTAMMFPSLSLNHAVFAPPPVAMLFFILIPGMSYSSKTTPRAFSSATSASTSSTYQNAWLAFEVPALPVGRASCRERV